MTSVFPQPGSQAFTLTMTSFPDCFPRCKNGHIIRMGGARISFFPELPIWSLLYLPNSLTQITAVAWTPVTVWVYIASFHTTTMASFVFFQYKQCRPLWPWAYCDPPHSKVFFIHTLRHFYIYSRCALETKMECVSWFLMLLISPNPHLGWQGSSTTYLYSQ